MVGVKLRAQVFLSAWCFSSKQQQDRVEKQLKKASAIDEKRMSWDKLKSREQFQESKVAVERKV